MAYTSENHSKHLLMCHLIFICKYRKKLLSKVGDDIKTEIESIANHYGWQIIEQEIDKDHIHILIRYSPKWRILDIVRLLK
jgi:putative transposase